MFSSRLFEMESMDGKTPAGVDEDLSGMFLRATEDAKTAWSNLVHFYGAVEKTYVKDIEEYLKAERNKTE